MIIKMGMFYLINKYYNQLVDGKPAPTDPEYESKQECVWEYDILGLISVSTYFY